MQLELVTTCKAVPVQIRSLRYALLLVEISTSTTTRIDPKETLLRTPEGAQGKQHEIPWEPCEIP